MSVCLSLSRSMCFGPRSSNIVLLLVPRCGHPTFWAFYSRADILVSKGCSFEVRSWWPGRLHTHTHLTALLLGLPGWAGTRKVKPILISLKQETVSGSGISWAICKYAPRSRQITMPAPHHSVFYRPNALPVAQPTASKHWRHSQVIRK